MNISVSGCYRSNVVRAAAQQIGVAPSTPTGLNAVGGDNRVFLTWNSLGAPTSFNVKRSTSPTGPFTLIVGSPSSPGFVDFLAVNGTTYYYVVSSVNTSGESANSTIASAAPAGLTLFAVPFGIIGDSTYSDEGYGNPMVGIPAELTTYSGRTATIVANAAVPGTSTTEWKDTNPGSLLANAIVAFSSGGAQYVMVGLGTNDCRTFLNNTSASAYRANLLIICNALVSAGFKVILNYPLTPLVGAALGTWTQAGVDLCVSYRAQVDSLVNGTTILQGDKRLPDYLSARPYMYQSTQNYYVGKTDVVGGYHQEPRGIKATARILAEGLEFAVNPAARSLGNPTTLPAMLNGDGSVNFQNRNAYHNLWTTAAWDERIGARFDWTHPGSPPDLRPTYYQPADNSDSLLRDFLGTGSTITIDGDLGNPGHNLRTLEAASRVKPWNWCVAHPGVDPGVGNFRLGLPRNATDITDPSNASDGFTPASTFLLQHRQQWVNMTSTYYQLWAGGNYWSVYGHINFVADDTTTNCGILRAQSFAYYNLCFAMSPRSEGGPIVHNDTDSSGDNLYTYLYWRAFEYGDFYGAENEGPVTSFGPSTVRQVFGKRAANPISTYRSPYINCGEAVAIDRDGMMTVLIGPTTRDGDAYPFPVYKFPVNEKPKAITLSGMNEIAAVAVWDVVANTAKIVVFAMQGWANKGHGTYWYGLSNEGSFSGFRRVGEIPLTMSCPDFILAGTDAQLAAAPDPGSINLSDANQRAGYANFNDAQRYLCFAKKGWIAVTSKTENKFALYDVSNWLTYIHSQYLIADQTAWNAVAAAHDAGTFPPNWMTQRPDLAPTLDFGMDFYRPTCMIASGYGGPEIGYNYSDTQKLLVASEEGTIRHISMGWYQDTYNWTGYNPPDAQTTWARASVWGEFWVGRGITSMCWAKFTIGNSDIAFTGVMENSGADRQNRDAHGYANALYVCCRGDRKIHQVITRFDLNGNEGNSRVLSAIAKTVEDKRINDPVHVSMSDRTNSLHIAGYNDRKLHSIQIGGVGRSPEYDGQTQIFPGLYFRPNPNNPSDPFGYCGSLTLPGCPRESSWNNVN